VKHYTASRIIAIVSITLMHGTRARFELEHESPHKDLHFLNGLLPFLGRIDTDTPRHGCLV